MWLSIYMDLTHNDYNMKASKVFAYMFASVCTVYLVDSEVLGIHLVTHRTSTKKKNLMRYSTKTNRLKWNTKIYLYSTKEGRKLEAEKPKQRGQTKHKNKLVDLNQNILY